MTEGRVPGEGGRRRAAGAGRRPAIPGALALYRRLLGLYPASFRREYGDAIQDLFARTLRDEFLRRGWAGVPGILLGGVRDLLGRSAIERAGAIRRGLSRRRRRQSIGDKMISVFQDLRYAVRTLVKRPGFTVIALLTLALGIGANTAIFTIVSGVLLRPLPYEAPERLVMLWQTFPNRDLFTVPLSDADYVTFREQNTTLSDVALMRNAEGAVLTGVGEPERVRAYLVTPNLFPMLGATASLGRLFHPEEEDPGNGEVVLLSNGFWRDRFGADPEIVGRTVTITDRTFTVIGVLSPAFLFPPPVTLFGQMLSMRMPDVWMPFTIDRANLTPGRHAHFSIARVKPGISFEQAGLEVQAIAERIAEESPNTNTGVGARIVPIHRQAVETIKPALLVLLGAVGLVLLIACTNVANLLLARAGTRRREVAIRVAVGASRGRLVRQLLTESLLLAAVGGGLGLALAFWGSRVMIGINPIDLPAVFSTGIDLRVLTFTGAVTVFTGLAFGLVPAFTTSKTDLQGDLAEGGRSSGGRTQMRIKNVLVVGQMALALALLIGAGLMIKSFTQLREVDPGFAAENLLTFGLRLPESRYTDDAEFLRYFDRVVDRLGRLPNVQSAAAIQTLPFAFNRAGTDYTVEGEPARAPGEFQLVEYRQVTPTYFKTMGMLVKEGRAFATADGPDAPRVAVVNETLARKHWSEGGAVGRRIALGSPEEGEQPDWMTVVGVVGDVRDQALDAPVEPMIYLPHAQRPSRGMMVVMRTTGDPVALTGPARTAVWDLDPDIPLSNVRTMEVRIDESVANPRFAVQVLTSFGVVALVLAAIGIYGVMSFAVIQQTRDIGIRMAFGAEPGAVLAMVLRRGLVLSVTGAAVGLAIALGATRAMKTMLFGVSSTDPVTFLSIPLILVAVAALATYLPARRATRVNPITALRAE